MSTSTLTFQALDTLFFREPRPFEAIGGSELSSLFPPPPRTLMGAVRTAIGDALGADWKTFKTRHGVDLKTIIGDGDSYDPLALAGIWLSHDGNRLYPAPLFLLQHDELHLPVRPEPVEGHGASTGSARTESDLSRLKVYKRLIIGATGTSNHLGNTRLPELPGKLASGQPLENTWLTADGIEAVLCGNVPTEEQIFTVDQLFERESRLGIARSNDTRTVIDGLLYQSEHIRPKKELTIEADISGLPDKLFSTRKMVRLGAEGRLAGIEASVVCNKHPDYPKQNTNSKGLILMLMSAGHFKQGWLPDGFNNKPEDINGITVWRGIVKGIALTLHSAVIGKAMREGGWDMNKNAPRPVESLVPAGSAYYCAVDNDNLAEAMTALHGKQIGGDPQLGRGIIYCGLWQQNEFNLSGEQQ